MLRVTYESSSPDIEITLVAYPLYGDRPYFVDCQGRFLGFVDEG